MILPVGLIIVRCGRANLECQQWIVEARGQSGLDSKFIPCQVELHSE